MQPRIGVGHDLHRLEPGAGLLLGGVKIECGLRAVAHSDGDALLHALTDAVLGALGGPDIGELFPDRDESNRGRDSAEFLQAALERAGRAGYRVGNADATVFLEQPKLGGAKEEIRVNLARLLGCEKECVSVKAKTGEGVGPVGEGKAVAAQAVVLLVERSGNA